MDARKPSHELSHALHEIDRLTGVVAERDQMLAKLIAPRLRGTGRRSALAKRLRPSAPPPPLVIREVRS